MDPMHNAQFPFFELPREIRDLVYWHAVVKDEPLELDEPLREIETRIFRVCKQIHEEASEMFYKESLFFIPIHLFISDEPVDRMLAGPLYRLPPKRLARVTKLDVDVPVTSLPKVVDERKALRRLTAFIEILAVTASPKLQLRFFCQDLLHHDSVTSIDIFAERSAIKLTLEYLPQRVLDRIITDNADVLQFLRLALRKIRHLFGKVQVHVIVLVHPAFLRKAKATLMLHGYPDYLLIGDLDPHKGYKNSDVLQFIKCCAAPEASGSIVQTILDGSFYECPLQDLEPKNAWMWRGYHDDALFAYPALEACRDAAKILKKLYVSEARVPSA